MQQRRKKVAPALLYYCPCFTDAVTLKATYKATDGAALVCSVACELPPLKGSSLGSLALSFSTDDSHLACTSK